MRTSPGHRQRARLALVAVPALIATLLFSVLAAAPAGAAGEVSDYLSRINSLRASVGVQPLLVDGELTAAAQGWAEHMAAAGVLSHSPNISSGITQSWSKVGENVGVGPDVASIFPAFVASAAHYKNLVDPAFNRVGVGVAYGGGRQWTCHRFMQLSGGGSPSPAPAPAPRPAPKPAPPARPSTPTTTAPSGNVAPVVPVTIPVPPPSPSGPPPPADSTRVATVLSALRQLAS
jgi:hypothetical protein